MNDLLNAFAVYKILCNYLTIYISELQIALLHAAKVLCDVELRIGLLLDFLKLDARSQLGESQLALLPVHLEHTLESSQHTVFADIVRNCLPDL